MRSRNVISEVCTATQVAAVMAQSDPILSSNPSIQAILDHFVSGRLDAGFRLIDSVSSEFGGCLTSLLSFRQFISLLRKVPFTKTDLDRRSIAISKFWSSERKCKYTNRRLRYFRLKPDRMEPIIRVLMSRTRVLVREYLGEFSPRCYRSILSHARPGPGLSIGTWNRFRTSPVYKHLATTPAVTPMAKSIAIDLFCLRPETLLSQCLWSSDGKVKVPFEDWITPHNRIGFVPKDGRTLRSIAVEPSLNVYLQLGVHEHLVRRLRSKGIVDLSSQETNQILSYLASKDKSRFRLATLDLKSASDSVSIELVRWLLDPSWFHFLDSLRSHSFLLDGVVTKSEKFSTMGNGFTFVLETVIFKAMSEAVRSMTGGSISSVYGDDIIIDSGSSLLLVEFLKFCGFSVNTDKSFFFGDFAESCGTDWYNGHMATPIYLRRESLDERDCYTLFNSLNRSIPGARGVRDYLLRTLGSRGLRGLENEDLGSCFFTPFNYLLGSNKLQYSSDHQTWKSASLVPLGTRDTWCPARWKYDAALIGEIDGPRLRGVTMFKEVYRSPGRRLRAWYSDIPGAEYLPVDQDVPYR